LGPFTTNEVALYGAILATLTFLFNLWRVMRERPKLQVRIVTTHYDDGGFSKVETTPTGGTASTPIVYFHVEVNGRCGHDAQSRHCRANSSAVDGVSG
jgi:hypothetical protein